VERETGWAYYSGGRVQKTTQVQPKNAFFNVRRLGEGRWGKFSKSLRPENARCKREKFPDNTISLALQRGEPGGLENKRVSRVVNSVAGKTRVGLKSFKTIHRNKGEGERRAEESRFVLLGI